MNGQTLNDFIIECLERAVEQPKPKVTPLFDDAATTQDVGSERERLGTNRQPTRVARSAAGFDGFALLRAKRPRPTGVTGARCGAHLRAVVLQNPIMGYPAHGSLNRRDTLEGCCSRGEAARSLTTGLQ